ncbi:MAG: prolipoprotein diacylglyceryl transferase [Chloroflexi bacterium]|nr:prolipoprotein diacylglyceryl transferase [Chloroflexota bacterium]
MQGIVIAIDPVAFTLGQFAVRWYGVAVVVAILAGFALGLHEAKRRRLDVDEVANLGLWAVVCAIVGARLFHVLDHATYYVANPQAILALYEGGLSIYGGIAGGLLAGAVYAWRVRLPLFVVLDSAAPALILAQAVGRVGCLINGDAQGLPTDLPWAFTYVHPDSLAPELGVAGHPYPLYEIIWDVVGFAILWRLRGRWRTSGTLFLAYTVYYSLGRFLLSFVRQETIAFWGLQQAQVLALAALFAAIMGLTYLLRLRQNRLDPDPRGL